MRFLIKLCSLVTVLSVTTLLPLISSTKTMEHQSIEAAIQAQCWQCLGKHLEKLSRLIQHLPSSPHSCSNLLNTPDTDALKKSSAFHTAAAHNNVALLEKLIEKDSTWEPKKHIKNAEGNTPMHFAAQYGSLECLRLLLEKDTNSWEPVRNRKNNNGQTPLKLALLNGHENCALLLIENNAKE